MLAASIRSGLSPSPTLAIEGEDESVEEESGVGVLPLHGVITPGGMGGLLGLLLGSGGGLDRFKASLLELAEDDSIKHIVLDINSPGGLVDMVPETARVVREVRESKPVTAVANTQAASAAYWIASQANEVVVTPSGEVGSIGVYMMHTDTSKALDQKGVDVTLVKAGRFKTEGNTYEPLTGDAKKSWQAKVDAVYGWFARDVAVGRGVSERSVREGYGQGRAELAEVSVSAGLADRVGTLDDVVVGILALEADQAQVEAESRAARRRRRAALL